MDNEQLKRLKKKRSSYKGQLTLFENYLLTLDDTTLSKRQVMELQLRITKLESVLKEFDAVQLDIECICDDAQLEISLAVRQRGQREQIIFAPYLLCKRDVQ
ncbi:hypothetical protein ACJJTC_001956 [Scirpophaga incertulas]